METIKTIYNKIKEYSVKVWSYLEKHPKTSRFVCGFGIGLVLGLYL